MMSLFEESGNPSRPSDAQLETSPLAFEKEFDGVRRQVVPDEETLHDPARYWKLGGGTD